MCAACAAGDDSPACGQSLYQVCTDSQGQASFCSACQSDFGSRECVAARQAYLSECEAVEIPAVPSAGQHRDHVFEECEQTKRVEMR